MFCFFGAYPHQFVKSHCPLVVGEHIGVKVKVVAQQCVYLTDEIVLLDPVLV